VIDQRAVFPVLGWVHEGERFLLLGQHLGREVVEDGAEGVGEERGRLQHVIDVFLPEQQPVPAAVVVRFPEDAVLRAQIVDQCPRRAVGEALEIQQRVDGAAAHGGSRRGAGASW
jgi:hypothetical protein